MSENPAGLPRLEELSRSDRIDLICDRFEQEYLAGRGPRILDYLAGADGTERESILEELLAVELDLRRRQGDRPALAEYYLRFPDDRQRIEAVFASHHRRSGKALTQVRSSQDTSPSARTCPHCRNPITVNELAPHSEAFCSCCGNHIRLEPSGQIDDVCELFAADLNRGLRPAIEERLAGWEEPERSKLLYELLRLEIDHGQRTGAPRCPDDYLSRFPQARAVIEEAFQMTVAPATVPMSEGEETLVIHSVLGDLRYHAKGGLGVVYRAEDQRLKRSAAVKFLRGDFVDNPRSREQFLQEAEITGRLEHPGVAPVYGLGESPDGRIFYVMRFIQGETLQEAISQFHGHGDVPDGRDRQLAFHELLSRFAAACKTVAYAHNRGVVHRDLKPANVMLGRYGETIVIDWGLATLVGRKGVFKSPTEKTLAPLPGSDSSQTPGGGTPAYMSPEQASGALDLAPASDVYSLGATLYALLTGQAPFAGNLQEITRDVIRGAFPRPTRVSRSVSKPLEAICLKAMSLDPDERYATALDLAEDVGRYLADAPVLAYREPITRQMARWARRHRVLAQSILMALLVLTVLGVVTSLWLGRQARTEQDLRVRSLLVAAEFAARTIANETDIRWRILEREAAETQLHALLTELNSDPANDAARASLQQWLDARIAENYAEIPAHAWSILTRDGTQVARVPSHYPDGKPYGSLGRNYAFRDYFHGSDQDFPPHSGQQWLPLPQPHNSTVLRSTNDGDLQVSFSVPIRSTQGADPIGVVQISVELGSFFDELKIPLSKGQDVLLVESRQYYLLSDTLQKDTERGEGLVLHHKDLKNLRHRDRLPRVSDELVSHMREAKSLWLTDQTQVADPETLLLPKYRDPLHPEQGRRWIAAFAPVRVNGRPPEVEDTGWFVIVQQSQ